MLSCTAATPWAVVSRSATTFAARLPELWIWSRGFRSGLNARFTHGIYPDCAIKLYESILSAEKDQM